MQIDKKEHDIMFCTVMSVNILTLLANLLVQNEKVGCFLLGLQIGINIIYCMCMIMSINTINKEIEKMDAEMALRRIEIIKMLEDLDKEVESDGNKD